MNVASASPSPTLRLTTLRRLSAVALIALAAYGFAYPGAVLLRDLDDPAMRGPGIPRRAVELHRDLSPLIAAWAEERVATGAAIDAPLHDVPTTEWPMFTAVFYLMATLELQNASLRGELRHGDLSSHTAETNAAVEAARALIIDPSHHTWVRTHWGDDYMHEENVFFRALVIAGLSAHAELTGDGSSLPMLRDQVETLAADLDRSELGILDDYPGECYPIDVLVTVGIIRRADRVLGTDHSAFADRALRAFTGAQADRFGLPRFRVDLPSGAEVQPSRGVGTSWSLLFARDLWPEVSEDWYRTYETHFYQDHGWAAGFREYAPGTEPEWTFEIDAGPVFDGFGTAASAFGIAAARRHGRFDHAAALSAELSGASWSLPDGEMLLPRAISHASDAPYLGEAALLYFLTVQPAPDAIVVSGEDTAIPGSVIFALVVYFGVPLAVLVLALRRWRAVPGAASRATLVGSGVGIAVALLLVLTGHGVIAFFVAAWTAMSALATRATTPPERPRATPASGTTADPAGAKAPARRSAAW